MTSTPSLDALRQMLDADWLAGDDLAIRCDGARFTWGQLRTALDEARDAVLDEVSDALLARRDAMKEPYAEVLGRRLGLEDAARIARAMKSGGAA